MTQPPAQRVLERGERRHKVVLLIDRPDSASNGAQLASCHRADVAPVETKRAAGRAQRRVEQPEQCGLAGPRRPDQRDTFAALHLEGQPRERANLAVANKKVDAGALDETIFQRMVSDGKLDSNQVNVFYTTPPYMDYVWAARKGLDPKLADAFAAAFLKLDGADPAHKAILDFLNATRYVRAEDASYDRLRQAATEAGLLK